MLRIIVAGPPRSGTTWAGEMLASGRHGVSVHEPDNDLNDSFALAAKAGLGRFPVVVPGAMPGPYGRLWDAALAGGRPANTPTARGGQVLVRLAPRRILDGVIDASADPASRMYRGAVQTLARPRTAGVPTGPGPVVVKSVHAEFSIEAVAQRCPDARVVVLRRDPRNAVASWLELGWEPLDLARDLAIRNRHIDPFALEVPDPEASALTRMAWDYALLDHALCHAASAHPDWVVVNHEDLCLDPVGAFGALFEALGADFDESAVAAIEASQGKGTGYQTQRVGADQPERWRERLDDQQVAEIEAGLAPFARSVAVR